MDSRAGKQIRDRRSAINRASESNANRGALGKRREEKGGGKFERVRYKRECSSFFFRLSRSFPSARSLARLAELVFVIRSPPQLTEKGQLAVYFKLQNKKICGKRRVFLHYKVLSFYPLLKTAYPRHIQRRSRIVQKNWFVQKAVQ